MSNSSTPSPIEIAAPSDPGSSNYSIASLRRHVTLEPAIGKSNFPESLNPYRFPMGFPIYYVHPCHRRSINRPTGLTISTCIKQPVSKSCTIGALTFCCSRNPHSIPRYTNSPLTGNETSSSRLISIKIPIGRKCIICLYLTTTPKRVTIGFHHDRPKVGEIGLFGVIFQQTDSPSTCELKRSCLPSLSKSQQVRKIYLL